MNLKNVFIVFGQTILVLLFLLIGLSFINNQIPGHRSICDAENIFIFEASILFVLIGIGLFINSWYHLANNKWKTYRILLITIIPIIFCLSLFLRQMIVPIFFGKEITRIEGINPINVKIALFKNGKFIAYTYDISCERENTGTYKRIGNVLTLKFEDQILKYLGVTYKIESDSVKCLDCSLDLRLKIK